MRPGLGILPILCPALSGLQQLPRAQTADPLPSDESEPQVTVLFVAENPRGSGEAMSWFAAGGPIHQQRSSRVRLASDEWRLPYSDSDEPRGQQRVESPTWSQPTEPSRPRSHPSARWTKPPVVPRRPVASIASLPVPCHGGADHDPVTSLVKACFAPTYPGPKTI